MKSQILVSLMFSVIFSGCVVTSNYYTGQTMEEKKLAFAIAADDIIIKSEDKSVEVKKSKLFTPSIIVSYGLPFRFETSLRYIPTKFFDGALRYQVNPRSFDILDCSLNMHYGILLNSYSYLKYGITVSKNINGFEPYVNYFAYKFIGANGIDVSDGYMSGVTEKFINDNQSIGFGIGIPLRKAKIYPEISYQYYANGFGNGLIHFGIGFRVFGN